MKQLASILGIVLALPACLVGGNDGTSQSNVIGGTTDNGDPAVGLLRIIDSNGGVGVCSGTLIAPQVMLTAGHCAEPAINDVSFATKPDLSAPIGSPDYISATVLANPLYNGDPRDGYDVAIILLDSPVNIAPVAIGPTPAAGAAARVVGYGMNVFGQDGTGVGEKRELTTAVAGVNAHEILTGTEGASTCHGDSGGPVFDSAGRIVATTSWGDPDCHGSAHDMRIDDNLDFIEQFVDLGGGSPTTPPSGGSNSCKVTQNNNTIECTNGACTCSVNGTPAYTCQATDPASACTSPGNCCGF